MTNQILHTFFMCDLYTMTSPKELHIREHDYETGFIAETEIFDKLRNKGLEITPTLRYDPFDCIINSKYVGEVKKRSTNKNTYPTTILPYSKLLEFKKVRHDYKDMILIFKFRDEDCYTTYRELCKNRVEVKPFTRYSGFTHRTRPHVFIPTSLLKPLDELVLA